MGKLKPKAVVRGREQGPPTVAAIFAALLAVVGAYVWLGSSGDVAPESSSFDVSRKQQSANEELFHHAYARFMARDFSTAAIEFRRYLQVQRRPVYAACLTCMLTGLLAPSQTH